MIENQLDISMKSVMLGFSKKYSLYNSGCLVHCISRLLNKPRLEVHEKLKQFKCFFADETGDVCLLDLTKVPLAYPQLKYIGKQVFNQDIALQAIKQAKGLIVEVDGNSIMEGTQQHFVFFTGNGELEDPLGGIIRKTTYYKKIISIRIFEVVGIEDMYKGLDLTNKESMKVAVDAWHDLISGKLINVTEDEKRILSFVKERNLTEGQVRQSADWLRDNIVDTQNKEITGLKATISDQYKEMDKKNLEYGKLLDEFNVLLPKYEELLKTKPPLADGDLVANLSWSEILTLLINKIFKHDKQKI